MSIELVDAIKHGFKHRADRIYFARDGKEMAHIDTNQEVIRSLLAQVQKLLDRIYPFCDAELDEEIQAFREQVLEQLHRYQDKPLDQTAQLLLKAFVHQLEEIAAEKDIMLSFDNNATSAALLPTIPSESLYRPFFQTTAASNNNLGPNASITSHVAIHHHYPSMPKSLSDEEEKLDNQNNSNKNITELKSIKTLLQSYYQANTMIRLPLFEIEQSIEQCYVNLALVEEAEQRAKEGRLLRANQQTAEEMFGLYSNRLRTYEDIYQVTQSVPLTSLFSHRRQVIVLGRAGIGKSTFCKYVTYQWGSKQAWAEFDMMYWLPLRHLRYYELKNDLNPTIIGLAHLAHFIHYVLDKECQERILLQGLTEEQIFEQLSNPKQKTLLLLDGYDEVEMLLQVKDTQEKTMAGKLFEALLKQSDYLLTSRPYAVQRSQFPLPRHCYYELLGFIDVDIPIYITRVFELAQRPTEEADNLIQILRKNPSIWGAAHVPIHLALICAVLRPNVFADCKYVTMSMLYQELARQLGKRFFEQQCQQQVSEMQGSEIDKLFMPLADFLGDLALEGLVQDTLIFDYNLLESLVGRHKNMLNDYLTMMKSTGTTRDQENQTGKSKDIPLLSLLKPILKTGLLHAINPHEKISNNVICYFPHASFQEYFAAYYLARWFNKNIKTKCKIKGKAYTNARNYIQETIREPRYEVVYWFLAGFLRIASKQLEKYFNIIIANLQGIDLIDKAKSLFIPKDSQQSRFICRLLQDESKFHQVLLLSRCIEEANLPSLQKREELLQMYRILAKELLISRAHKPIDRCYRWWIDYLKLSPHLLDVLGIVKLLKQEKEIGKDQQICTRLDLTLSQLEVKDVVDSLIQLFNQSADINVRCQAIESLTLIVRPQERIRFMSALLDYMKKEIDFVSLTAAKALLKIDQRIEGLSWLLKYFLRSNDIMKKEIFQFLLSINEDILLAQLCQLDLSLKDWLIKRKSFFNWRHSESIFTLPKAITIAVVGGFCGKSCLVDRFIQGHYWEHYFTTSQEETSIKYIEINGKTCKFEIIDTSSFEFYFNNSIDHIRLVSDIIIICFDITNIESITEVISLSELFNSLSKPMMLAGLKKDLESERQVSFQKGTEIAERYKTIYTECSAKTNENVTELFILAMEMASLKKEEVSPPQTKEAFLEEKCIEAILASISTFIEAKSELMNVLRILKDEQNGLEAKWAEHLLKKLNEKDSFEIMTLSLIHNMQYSDQFLQEISNEQLTELEKSYPDKIVKIYSECLAENDVRTIKIMLSRLSNLKKLYEREVVSACINMLDKDNDIREISIEILGKLNITQFDERQCSMLYKACVRNLDNILLTVRLFALDYLKKLKKMSMSEVIIALIKNLTHANKAIYETAAQALQELESELSEIQRQMVFDIYVKDLRHVDSARYHHAMLAIKQLGKADAPEVIATHINNLTQANIEIYATAVQTLEKLEDKLSEMQRQMVFDIYVKDLGHADSARRHHAMLAIKQLGKTDAPEVIAAHINNLTQANIEIYATAVQALEKLEDKLSEIQRQIVFDIYVKDLGHADSARRHHAMLAIKQLGKADAPEVIATHINNLTQANIEVYATAVQALEKLEDKLSEIQQQMVFDIYVKDLGHADSARRHHAMLAIKRLGKADVPEVITAHINNLTQANIGIYATAVQALQELEGELSEIQRQMVFDICVKDLDHTDSARYHHATLAIKRLGKADVPEVIAAHINNLTHTNEVIYATAAQALEKLEDKLSEIQRHIICDAYTKNLRHFYAWRWRYTMLAIKRLGKADAPEVIAAHINNLTHTNEVIYATAAQALQELEGELSEIQRQMMLDIYVKDLDHADSARRHHAMLAIKRLSKADAPEVIAVQALQEVEGKLNEIQWHIKNLTHPNQLINLKALDYLEKIYKEEIYKEQLPEVITAKRSMLAQSSIEQFEENNHIRTENPKVSNSAELNDTPMIQQNSFIKNENNVCLDDADAVYQTFPETENSDGHRENLNQTIEPKYAALISKQNNPIFNRVPNQEQALTEALQDLKNNNV